jgi:hypothetical protein
MPKRSVEEFRAKKFEPEAYTLYSYAGVQIIKQAAEAAKSLDPKKVAEKMHSGMQFKTVLGDISYDKKGDITKLDYVMYVWKKDPQRQDNVRRMPLAPIAPRSNSRSPRNSESPPVGGLSFFTRSFREPEMFRGATRSSG